MVAIKGHKNRVKIDLKLNLVEKLMLNRTSWKKGIYIADTVLLDKRFVVAVR